MSVQRITTPSGETMVVLSLDEYERLSDAADVAAADQIRRDIDAGRDELVPSAIADRLIEGENPVRVWREHRGMTARALADAAGIGTAYLSEIETGRKDGSLSVLKAIAGALNVDLDDIV
ncbi:helix-turn-helix transcriptional regulator [Fodinicurvata sp. EGI_FJ10296]|uniref:helix-turn-helix domain-containing protein n=1 Tax=Fodinicurvata sp. EGI_FJ10296 TaxID=3231908 RepID=UPI003455B61A